MGRLVKYTFQRKLRARWGRRFGFLKFKEVRDREEMSKKLGNVW
jgi:hypothetical protein